ncbi:MAG: HEPN domain-containing protein [Clostridiales bacterium]|nr:HEPN domain-containing protein [Clostridiales bacterium]
MDKKEIIKYWIDTSEQDYKTMLNLYKSGDYHWCLFLGHLVIEKLLKAIFVMNVDRHLPRIHDLLRLAELSKIETSEKQKDVLDLITTFNISARYPDYKQSFYERCNKEFTSANIEKIKGLRTWLLSLIGKE